MIPITPSLCNNIISRSSLDITDAHSQKIKEEEKRKQRPRRNKERLAAARA
jgi:hypothetical protein